MELFAKAEKQIILLKEIRQVLAEKLKGTSKEILRVSQSNGVFQYYTVKEGQKFYIHKTRMQYIEKLIQRDYHQELTKVVDKNLKALELFIKNYSPQKYFECYSQLPPARRTLVQPLFIDNEMFASKWQSIQYKKKSEFSDEASRAGLLTMKNEHVRSKSEVIIANILKAKDVPYHYEYPVKISSSITFHPDFFCLNKRTRQEFYWEHCGRMDEPEYARSMVKRLSLYSRKNIIPGKNLILTMETYEHPLNTKDVEQLVESFLL